LHPGKTCTAEKYALKGKWTTNYNTKRDFHRVVEWHLWATVEEAKHTVPRE
jgi:hypothetical protein